MKKTLLKLLSCCDNRELHKIYQKCRQELSDEDFRKEIRTIMKRNKWTDEWNVRYKAFLDEQRRKKLLLKALEGFKP